MPASLCKTVTELLDIVSVINMLTDIKCTDRHLACIGECVPLSGRVAVRKFKSLDLGQDSRGTILKLG